MGMPYPLQEHSDDREERLRVSIDRNGSDYKIGVINNTLQNNVGGNDTEIGALPVEDGVTTRLEIVVQKALVDGPHRFAAS